MMPSSPNDPAEPTAVRRAASRHGIFGDLLDRLHGRRGVAIALWNSDGVILDANAAFLQLTGYSQETLQTGTLHWEQLVAPAALGAEQTSRALLDETGMTPPYESLWIHADGTSVPVLVVLTTIERDASVGCLFVLDQRTQKASEAVLRDSEERYRLVTRAAGGVLWEWDIAGNTIVLGEGASEQFGWEIDGVPMPLSWFLQRIHPDDSDAMAARTADVQASRITSATHAFRFRRANGRWAMVHDHFHVVRNDAGAPSRVVGIMLDTSERHAVQEQLRQSQKMDAVGHLAGGIAHDFNNLLTVISGNTSLALEQLDAASPLRVELAQIARATERAAELTRQLLAFSRKQLLLPQPLDVNTIVAQLARLLDRLLPATISVRLTPAAGTGVVNVDRAQLEQVILSLVINAREAMPAGGTLEVRTDEFDVGERSSTIGVTVGGHDFALPPDVPINQGRYVHLTVTDTGSGMNAETRSHAFEPFFTTKPVGLGTGLGLATVYGIVKQSEGYVWIDSTVGEGTTVHVCLPSFAGELHRPRSTPPSTPDVHALHTVLLVEDEDGVRDMALRVLRAAGYRVLAARDGAEALALWQDDPRQVDVVVTDVVMPGLNGSELAARLREERADLPVLFMSGFARNAAIGDPPGDRRTRFLQKPFSVPALKHAVSELVLLQSVR